MIKFELPIGQLGDQIVDKNNHVICDLVGPTVQLKSAKAKLVITAVNAMPKVIGLLRGVDEEKIHLRTLGFETLCKNLLEQLEAANGS